MIFAPSLSFVAFSRQNLVYLPLADFGVCSAKKRIQTLHFWSLFGEFYLFDSAL